MLLIALPVGLGLLLPGLHTQPHGVDLGPLKVQLPEWLPTPYSRINVAPPLFLADLARAATSLARYVPATTDQLTLISRRHRRDNNSWMHNARVLVKGRNRCTLLIHPTDAYRLGILTGQVVQVRSRVGALDVPAEVTTDIMPGVVSIPHGYGHNRPDTRLNVAQQRAGASINDLTDEALLGELTGNAALSGVLVRVSVSV